MRNNPTLAEAALWTYLEKKKMGHKFRRQVPMMGYIVDFYCPKAKLVVEVDGSSHKTKKHYDKFRTKVLESIGITVMRFKNQEVFERPKLVVISIKEKMNEIIAAKQN